MALSLVDFWVVQNIERNTAAAAANSTLPEYVGEANWIAKNLYAQDAAATQTPRALRGIAALIILGVCCAAGGGAGAMTSRSSLGGFWSRPSTAGRGRAAPPKHGRPSTRSWPRKRRSATPRIKAPLPALRPDSPGAGAIRRAGREGRPTGAVRGPSGPPRLTKLTRKHAPLDRRPPVAGGNVGVGGAEIRLVRKCQAPLASLRHPNDDQVAPVSDAPVDHHVAVAHPPWEGMAVGRNIDADEVAQIAGSEKHEIGGEPFQLAFISARRLVDRRRDHRQVDEEAVRRPDHFADAGLSDGEVKRGHGVTPKRTTSGRPARRQRTLGSCGARGSDRISNSAPCEEWGAAQTSPY